MKNVIISSSPATRRYEPTSAVVAIPRRSTRLAEKLSVKSMAARLSCEDGIQECMESMPDLRANNAERRYLDGLNKKLRAFEGRLTKSDS